MLGRAVALGFLGATAACLAPRADRFRCSTTNVCPPGYTPFIQSQQCRCYRSPPDGGTVDGAPEGGSPDADDHPDAPAGSTINAAPVALALGDDVQLLGLWQDKVVAQRWRSGGTLDELEVLSRTGCRNHGMGASPDGIVTAVWTCFRGQVFDVESSQTQAADGRSWTQLGSPVTGAQGPGDVAIAAVATGGPWVAIGFTAPPRRGLTVARYTNGSWSALVQGRPFDGVSTEIRIVAEDAGAATVAWLEGPLTARPAVRIMRIDAEGGPGEPISLGQEVVGMGMPLLFQRPDGWGIAVWRRFEAGAAQISAQRFFVASPGDLNDVGAKTGLNAAMAVTIDGANLAHLVWVDAQGGLSHATREMGTGPVWSATTAIAAASATVSGLLVAPLPSGVAILWGYDIGGARELHLRVVRGSVLEPTVDVDPLADADVGSATLVVRGNGAPFVAWVTPEGELRTLAPDPPPP